MSVSKTILFVAVHKGPYLSIAPLEREFEPRKVVFLVEGPAKEARRAGGQAYWDLSEVVQKCGTIGQFLKKQAIMTSTSYVAE